MTEPLALIAALDQGGVIGRDGSLPWRLPHDLRHFKRTTMGHCLILGRKTWQSLPGALPGRTILVLSRNASLLSEGAGAEGAGAEVLPTLGAAVARARELGDDEPIVGGGAALYEIALPVATRLWLTRVHAAVEGDVHFPDWKAEADGWIRVAAEPHAADERHAHAFTIEEWVRRPGPDSRR